MCELNSGEPVRREVRLAGVEHAVHPAELVLRAVVGVQEHPGAVGRGERVDVLGAGDRPEDRRLVALHTDALAGDERGAAVGELDDHRRVDRGSGLHHTVDRVAAGAVGRRQGEATLLGQGEHLGYGVAGEDAGRELGCCGHGRQPIPSPSAEGPEDQPGAQLGREERRLRRHQQPLVARCGGSRRCSSAGSARRRPRHRS